MIRDDARDSLRGKLSSSTVEIEHIPRVNDRGIISDGREESYHIFGNKRDIQILQKQLARYLKGDFGSPPIHLKKDFHIYATPDESELHIIDPPHSVKILLDAAIKKQKMPVLQSAAMQNSR